MLDHLLEMPDDEPILWTECPQCLREISYVESIPEFSCTDCEEHFKIPIMDFFEEAYDY